MTIRIVIDSPKTKYPTIKAVIGSSAPRIAVGVEPIKWIDDVVVVNENTVGKKARHNVFIQSVVLVSGWSGLPKGIITMKINHPNRIA